MKSLIETIKDYIPNRRTMAITGLVLAGSLIGAGIASAAETYNTETLKVDESKGTVSITVKPHKRTSPRFTLEEAPGDSDGFFNSLNGKEIEKAAIAAKGLSTKAKKMVSILSGDKRLKKDNADLVNTSSKGIETFPNQEATLTYKVNADTWEVKRTKLHKGPLSNSGNSTETETTAPATVAPATASKTVKAVKSGDGESLTWIIGKDFKNLRLPTGKASERGWRLKDYLTKSIFEYNAKAGKFEFELGKNLQKTIKGYFGQGQELDTIQEGKVVAYRGNVKEGKIIGNVVVYIQKTVLDNTGKPVKDDEGNIKTSTTGMRLKPNQAGYEAGTNSIAGFFKYASEMMDKAANRRRSRALDSLNKASTVRVPTIEGFLKSYENEKAFEVEPTAQVESSDSVVLPSKAPTYEAPSADLEIFNFN